MNKILSLIFVTAAVSSYPSFAAEIPSCRNQENIVASGLVGSWTLDVALSENLHGISGLGPAESTITDDDSVRKLFGLLGAMDKCSYLSGRMTLKWTDNGTEKSLSSPFVVTESAGNPAIWYDERGYVGSGPIKELHRSFLMFAKGKTVDRDILFWGGDHNNQPLTAFVRK